MGQLDDYINEFELNSRIRDEAILSGDYKKSNKTNKVMNKILQVAIESEK